MRKISSLFLALLLLLLCSCRGPAADVPEQGEGVVDPSAHTDTDDNGYCDDCGTYLLITVDFFAINDLHGSFDDSNSNDGVDELTTYLKKIALLNERTVLLSSGDMWQGSSESNLPRGRIITDWMNELDFAAMTLGNHEFDWGEEAVRENAEAAEFPFLAINVFARDTGERVEYCQPSALIECGGIQIGIIGAVGDCYSSISGEHVKDIFFKTGNELTALVQAESERLRGEGADFIVYSLHDGHDRSQSGRGSISNGDLSAYYDPSLSREGFVDLVFEGHTHAKYALKDAYGVYHLQNGGYNEAISHVEITLNYVTNSSSVRRAENTLVSGMQGLSDDPIVDALLEKYEDVLSIASRVVGYNGVRRNGDTLRQKIAELYWRTGLEKWGAEYDVVLGGGFLSVRHPYDLPAGEVTYSMLQSLFPFDNELVLCSISGADLRDRFLESTNSNYFVSCDPSLLANLDPSARYYIITDTYSSSYAPNRLTEVERYGAGTYARDLLADYISTGAFE